MATQDDGGSHSEEHEEDADASDSRDAEELAEDERMFKKLKFVQDRIVITNELELVEDLIDRAERKQAKHVEGGSTGYGQLLSCLGGCLCTALHNLLRQMVGNERAWFMAQHALANTMINNIMVNAVSKRADEMMQELLAEEASGTATTDQEKKSKKKKNKKKKNNKKKK